MVFLLVVAAVAGSHFATLPDWSSEGSLALVIVSFSGWCGAIVFGLAARTSWNVNKQRQDELAALSRRSEAADAANKAKSRYLANVSHEIRSPLNAIYGYAQLIERSDHESSGEAARVIRRSAEHLTSLVEGLLDISLLENGVMRIKSDPVNLREFIEQICSMMRPDAVAKGLEFRTEIPERLPDMVRMDQSRLRQVLLNLLSNAIKFTDRGSVTLQLRYSNQIAVFEIADTGPGIAESDRERIFVPFERGGGEEQQRQPGVGLGLPITRAIAEILGGKVELDSEPGQGSRFRVTLMLGEVSGLTRSVPAALAPFAALGPIVGHEGKKRSILLVDDDLEQLAFMRALLGSLGFAVTAAPDGETGVSLARDMAFDLAILDIGLPGISGWDTAAQLCDEHGENLRIIMLSANVQELRRPETRKPVHDLFLAKPVNFQVLIEGLGGLLELTWKRGTQHAVSPVRQQPLAVRAGAAPHIARIREFLSIGHYRGVEKAIEELAESVPEAGELVTFLLDGLDRFDLSGMARKLEDY